MRWLAQPLLIVLLAVIGPLPADEKPTAKLPIGKDTTVIDGPVDADGWLDFETALNERLGKGIKPEANAVVLLWKAIGPGVKVERMPAAYFRALGTEEPPTDGDYLRSHAHLNPGAKPGEIEEVRRELGIAAKGPWSPRDFPRVAALVAANEKALAVVVEASRRPDYFNPLVTDRFGGRPACLIEARLPHVQRAREAANLLAVRAMLRVQAGAFDDARADLATCHRLGRLMSRGGLLIESLVAVAAESVAVDGELAFLAAPGVPIEAVRGLAKELAGLPVARPVADKLDLAERFTFLDLMQSVRRGGVKTLERLSEPSAVAGVKPADANELAAADWSIPLRACNEWYDRIAGVLRKANRADRLEGIAEIEADLKAKVKRLEKEGPFGRVFYPKITDPKLAGETLGDIIIGKMLPAFQKVQTAHDRAEQRDRNLRLALARSAYRADRGKYPATLADLAPKYLDTVPDDLFAGRPLAYAAEDGGYTLRSVGPDGEDGGDDDIIVRMTK